MFKFWFISTAIIGGMMYVAGGIGLSTYLIALLVVLLVCKVIAPLVAIIMIQRFITSMR